MISTGGEGKVTARKRLRGKIGNPSSAPELKSYNAFAAVPAPENYYAELHITGVYAPSGSMGCVWYPIALTWPQVGALNYQRVGNKIRVKYLRFKGYVASSPYLIQQVRYRFVLYRLRKQGSYNMFWLQSLYKNFLLPDAAADASNLQSIMVGNYYNSFMDPDAMKAQECKRRVLFKGLLKPSADIGNYSIRIGGVKLQTSYTSPDNVDAISGQVWGSTFQVGQASSTGYFNAPTSGSIPLPSASENVDLNIHRYSKPLTTNTSTIASIGTYQPHDPESALPSPINSKAYFPIDFVINMNDNINCEEFRYILVVESDVGVGQNALGEFDSSNASSNYFFRVTPHIYYTDD